MERRVVAVLLILVIRLLSSILITNYQREKDWQEFLTSIDKLSQVELEAQCTEWELDCTFTQEYSETFTEVGSQISADKENMAFVYSLGDYPIEEFNVSWGAVGDVIYYRFNDWKVSGGYNFEPMYTKIEEKIKSYDIASYTQESIAAGCTTAYPLFCSPYDVIETAQNVGFDIANTANNHSLDQGHSGIEKSLNNFDKYEVTPVGTYKQADTEALPVLYEKNGINFGVLSYATSLNGLVMDSDLTYTVSMYDEDEVKKDIEYLNSQNVDFIVCFMHWGAEYTEEPSSKQKDIAQFLTDNKVDVVLGSHSHTLNPIDYLDSSDGDHQSVVMYSLGNFEADQHSYVFETAYGGILELDFVKEVKNNKLHSKAVTVRNFYPTFNKPYSQNLVIVPLADSSYKSEMTKRCGIVTKYQDISCGN